MNGAIIRRLEEMREMVVGQKRREALIRNMEEALERQAKKGKRYCRIKETDRDLEQGSKEEGSKLEANFDFEKMS